MIFISAGVIMSSWSSCLLLKRRASDSSPSPLESAVHAPIQQSKTCLLKPFCLAISAAISRSW